MLFDRQAGQNATYTVTHTATAGSRRSTGSTLPHLPEPSGHDGILPHQLDPLRWRAASLVDASDAADHDELTSTEWDTACAAEQSHLRGNGFFAIGSGKGPRVQRAVLAARKYTV